MKPPRLLLLAASVGLSAVLGFAARGLVHDLIVIPLSYAVWQVGVLMGMVPELVRWGILVVVLGLVMAWQLVPDLQPSSPRTGGQPTVVGQVEALAVWLLRGRASNYFKWQLAHRLGLVSRSMEELVGRNHDGRMPSQPVAEYLDAGLSRSFVDFPAARRFFERPGGTPLDVDPAQVVEHLESQLSVSRGNHADRL